MPVSPEFAANLAKELLALYSDAEETLLIKVARRLAAGIDQPGWADRKLLEIQSLRAEVEDVISALQAGSADAVDRALRIGYNRGIALAGNDMLAAGAANGVAFTARVNERAVNALINATNQQLDMTGLRIRRWAIDVYSDVIHQAVGQVVVGVETRQEAARRAMGSFAKRGVTGFIDKAGRAWDLASYAEMSIRTSTGQAMVQGHVDKLVENGLDLVMVSNAPEECRICRPWEGQVLSLTGVQLGQQSGSSLLGSGTVTIKVKNTLAEATAAGLFHPNCRHSTSLYQIGVTTPIVNTADPQGDVLRQRQRLLERNVRSVRKQLAVAKGFHEGYNGAPPNPFTAELKKVRTDLARSRADLSSFVEENDRKNLAYRTSLKSR